MKGWVITPVRKFGRARLITGFCGKQAWQTSISEKRLLSIASAEFEY